MPDAHLLDILSGVRLSERLKELKSPETPNTLDLEFIPGQTLAPGECQLLGMVKALVSQTNRIIILEAISRCASPSSDRIQHFILA